MSLHLEVVRDPSTPNGTLGTLYCYVDDVVAYRCFTLEDPVRLNGVKIWGDTAIPAGTYRVALRYSSRFQKELPGIQDVPGFEGCLLHGGDTKVDTHGCPLLGTQIQALQPKPRIGLCTPAVSMVVSLLKKHGSATLTVKDKA